MPTAAENEIRDFWESTTCGTIHSESERFSKEYFDEIEAHRYRAEPFIPGFARFTASADRRVLEVGIGAATDFINFARNGARLSGVDLTPAAVEHARRRLELERLDAHVEVASAERLPFADNSFDMVYSWGVLHHAADPECTFAEVRRVLAPGGEARLMLYGRHSWVAYRRFLFGLLVSLKRRQRPQGLGGAIAHFMESPGTRCYTREEIVRAFTVAGFTTIEVEGFLTTYDQRYIGPLARRVRQDWFLGVVAS